MASSLIVGAGYLAFLVMLGSVIGTVDRRERYVFVAGVLLLLIALTFLRGTAGAVLGLVGIAAAVAAAVPLLRAPAPSS